MASKLTVSIRFPEKPLLQGPQPSLHSRSLNSPVKALRLEFLTRGLKETTQKKHQHSNKKKPNITKTT